MLREATSMMILLEGALALNAWTNSTTNAALRGDLATRGLLEEGFFIDGQIWWLFIARLVLDRVLTDPDLVRWHDARARITKHTIGQLVRGLLMRGVLEVVIGWFASGKLPFIRWSLQAHLVLILSVLPMNLSQTSILL